MKIRYVLCSVVFLHLLSLMKPFLNEHLYDYLGIVATLMTVVWFLIALVRFGGHIHRELLKENVIDKK